MRKITFLLIVCFVLISFTPVITLGEEAPVINNLSLEEAEKQAVSYSLSLKGADMDIERAYEVRKSAGDQVRFMAGVPFTPVGPQDATVSSVYAALLGADLNWRTQEKMLDARIDAVRVGVFQAYTDVLKAQQSLLSAEANHRSALWKLNATQMGFQYGVRSQSELELVKAGYEASKAAYKAAQEGEAKAYQALNRLMGYEPDTRWVLQDDPQYAILEMDSLEYHINKVIADSPMVWSAEQKGKIAKSILDLYPGSSAGEPYTAKALDVDKAKLEHQNTKEALRNQVEGLYLQLRQLEEQYQAAQEQARLTEETLRIKKVGYEVGINTKGEVLAGEADLIAAQAQVNSLKYAHETQKRIFAKPWVYAFLGS